MRRVLAARLSVRFFPFRELTPMLPEYGATKPMPREIKRLPPGSAYSVFRSGHGTVTAHTSARPRLDNNTPDNRMTGTRRQSTTASLQCGYER